MEQRIQLTNEQAKNLIETYGSPLYVYDEKILRERCKEVKNLLSYENYRPNYSAKANTNIELLKIVRNEGFLVDAMSPGEILLEEAAGYPANEILFIANNVSAEEMQFAIERNIVISVDSLSQLAQYCRLNPGGRVAVRLNPEVGAGHSDKVITAGKKTKFGIMIEDIPQIKAIVAEHNLQLVGLTQHIGSLFLQSTEYVQACQVMTEIAMKFEGLEFIDFGGGLGVPYRDENRLDLEVLGTELDAVVKAFVEKYPNKSIQVKTEPGRYIVAECSVLLGTVTSTKVCYGTKYIGSDLGFNVLMRPVMYDSYHEVKVFNDAQEKEVATLVGNICETGDIMAKDRELPVTTEGDIIGVENAGAYGYCMASCYNSRLRPAEVLIQEDGEVRLIRRRDTLEDILRQL